MVLDIRHQEKDSKDNLISGSLGQNYKDTIYDALAQEFKSPLGTMLGMLDLLLTTAMSLKQKEYLEVACTSGRSLMSLIDSVLTFSEIQSGQIKLIKQDCHLAEILDEVVEGLAEKALKKSINIGYVLPVDFPAVVITDPAKLQQIIVELLDNAIKFTHFGEVAIYVELDAKKQCVDFVIKDKGIGIDKKNHQQIFKPFFQVNSASEKIYQGLGLGLTIAKKLATMMKGRLDLTSSLSDGSEFTLSLPIQLSTEKSSSLKSDMLTNQTFLLLTQSPLIRDSVSQSIQSQGGTVTVSASSQDALKLFSDASLTAYSAVIVDEDLGDIPLGEFFGLLEDSLNFSDTFALILSNPYFSSYHINDLQFARLAKPLLASSLAQLLIHKIATDADTQQLKALADLDCGNGINVLIVEDSRINQQVVEAMLIRLNCRHQVASNGKVAVEKVVYGDFDVVLMDCNMPVLSGYAATRQIRGFEEQDAGKLPIIGMATNDTDLELCMSAGMTDVVQKPLSLVQLRDLLSKWTFFPSGRADNVSHDQASLSYTITPRSPANNLSFNPCALDKLVKTLGGSITHVIKDFCLDMEIYIQSLRSAINQKNESEICYIAHTLKGAARNFGADQMVRLSAQLEEKV
jgi:CheY-like chemotaxis protein/nitrogen-specific signal transduction histidine kinase